MTTANNPPSAPPLPSGETRAKLVRERCRSSAAFASRSNPTAATTSAASTTEPTASLPLLFTSTHHKGLEVIFAVVPKKDKVELDAIHARSRVVFQRILLLSSSENTTSSTSSNSGDKETVVAITSNNGNIYILTSHGRLQSYIPHRADPKVYAFGKFRWEEGSSIHTSIDLESKLLNRGDNVILSASHNSQVLVSYKNALAVYNLSKKEEEAELMWRDTLGANIDHASISGDGAAIAVALRGEGVGVPFPFGVRTFCLGSTVVGKSKSTACMSEKETNAAATAAAAAAIHPSRGHVRNRSAFEVGPVENPPMPSRGDNNFDGLMANVFGESNNNTCSGSTRTQPRKNKVTYQPGPFLVHSAPVSRISFRGAGTTTSSAKHNCKSSIDTEEGNDLLLTTCSNDCSVRIFSQNSWRQLMQWNSPPKSRADWVSGLSAANLGDLDTSPGKSTKKEKGSLSPIPKDVSDLSSHHQYGRHPSAGSNNASGDAGINASLMNENLHQTPNPSAIPSHSEPGSHAGAWIAELTFRNTFPALRLSRLSYMKSGGDDALPAHFESVAAILPAGSLDEGILLEEGNNEGRIEIEGVWPLWDPWEAEGKSSSTGAGGTKWVGAGNNGTPANAAGEGGAPRWLGDGVDLGGSHVPPSELRITSCHSNVDCVNQIEMPLWGDKDFGAMEFGSPIRHVMTMPEVEIDPRLTELPSANLEFEGGSRLCARTSLDKRSIDLWWRKHAAVNLEEDFGTPTSGPKIFRDISLTPLPLRLPSLTMPGKTPKQSDALAQYDKHSVSSLYWWPDENFGGPLRLVTLTKGGSLIVFEMPPPWSALEPPMPSYDPFDDTMSRGSSVGSGSGLNNDSFEGALFTESFDGENQQYQYEVSITPHPDFGIGLRLEAQAQGMPAIAGSFKKHPLSGGRLPAEREGVISLGDELLAVNGISLEGMPFEKAITTVRQIGFDSFGAPLRMRFRRCKGKRSRGSAPSHSSGSRSSRPQKVPKDSESQATVEVGADSENQQEFGRIVAIVRDVVAGTNDQSCPPAMLLIPWNFGKGAVVSQKMCGGALIMWAVPGCRTIKAARLEVVLDVDPENSRFIEIGIIQLDEKDSSSNQYTIKSISLVSSTEKGWLVAVLDSNGNTSLLFIDTRSSDSAIPSSPSGIKAQFRHYPSVFNVHDVAPVSKKSDPKESCVFRAFSIELFGCMGSRHGSKELSIWSALPETKHWPDSSIAESPYKCSTINIDDVSELSNEVIIDFRWIRSGFMDAFPWLILFTQRAAVLYRRPCHELLWQQAAILFYKSGSIAELMSPYDAFPHLTSAFQCAIDANDEQSLMRSDWHPESILANICTEGGGVQLALQSHTYSLYSWLSQWMNPDESLRPSWDGCGSLASAPFRVVTDKTVAQPDAFNTENDSVETSANSMAAMSLKPEATSKPQSQQEIALSDLLNSLCPFDESSGSTDSKAAMSSLSYTGVKQTSKIVGRKSLPSPLLSLNKDEQTCVWVIGDIVCNMPSFKRLDSLSQHCLFSVTFMRRLIVAREKSQSSDAVMQDTLNYVGGRPVLKKQMSSVNIEQNEAKHTAASAALLSALMSGTQSRLIDACRPKNEKFNWESARAVGIPFWVRSDKSLVSVAEEIAQTVYKSTKSVMDCALYCVAMRNMKKLRTIAATDRSDSGKKFFTFLTDHDFSSDRGRNAAEKNAYSLLRKRKYASAASFFLLAEPPMIKTALNIIKSQMKDVSLAFFVARLMEYALKSPSGPSDSLTIGGGFNLSNMGGGGGFAGSGSVVDNSLDVEDNSQPFHQWHPGLGLNARSVLQPDIQDSIEGDNCFDCLQLLWLDRPNDAMLRLAHMPADRTNSPSVLDCVAPLVSSPGGELSITDMVKRTNAIINFCSSPTLLKGLQPQRRVLWSSVMIVSRALNRCGIEIPSLRIALDVGDSVYINETQSQSKKKANTSATNGVHYPATDTTSSSIFDSFGAPPPKAKPQPASDPTASSIFDSFDAPPPKAKAQPAADPMASSIFDSFDAPPPKPKAHSTATDPMSSSIFDSFDVPPPKPKTTPSDPMASSIFDSFDAAPPRPKATAQPVASDPMTSSIFDSFDAVPPGPKAKPQQKAADPTASSIFDSFDAPNSRRQPSSIGIAKNSISSGNLPVIDKEEPINIPDFSPLWIEWKERLVRVYAASRLLREMARICSSFHSEPHYPTIESLVHHNRSPISAGAYEVLHKPCDSDGLLTTINNTLNELKASFGINEEVVIEEALQHISFSVQPRRLACFVLLQCLLGRSDLAEDKIRDASQFLMSQCQSLGLSNDSAMNNSDVKSFISSQWARRYHTNNIFQLEICMWLHRGGTFDVSSSARKEALLAVRVGLAIVNWGRCYQTLDTLIKAEPDCPVDFDVGRNLWRSMKIITVNENALDCVEGVTSGGWEFLVDCCREEATEMLRDGLPGQFLIRPHPGDPGVFTISFKTNLVPTETPPAINYDDSNAADSEQKPKDTPSPSKVIKRDDVVQHAIIRLTDTGFRCGSFGPFATLTKLLQAVSGSLPFALRFNDPPVKGIIKERGVQTSPNAFLFKKLALHSTAEFIHVGSKNIEGIELDVCSPKGSHSASALNDNANGERHDNEVDDDIKRKFGLFAQLLFLSDFRKQLCAVAAVHIGDPAPLPPDMPPCTDEIDEEYDGSISEGSLEVDEEENLCNALRMVRPLLNWCRAKEIDIVDEIAPLICDIHQPSSVNPLSVSINASGDEFEIPTAAFATLTIEGCATIRGDSMIRNCIQAGSGVDFRTLRVGEPGNSVIVVLFGKEDAIKWLASHETGGDENEAKERLQLMELTRVIEPITWSDLSLPKGYAASHPTAASRYRFVDPWEVEPLESKAGETASAALGRGKYQSLTVGEIAGACEHVIRATGGLHLLGLWSSLKGGIYLTKALCSAHPSWERDAGGDLLMKGGFLMEPSPYENSIRQHLYGNSLFRSLNLPQRFLALVQVDLLDLKNVTTPSGSSSVTAYAMLRLKRKGGSAPLNHKARSLDSAITQARKISKISGPNAPASWGSTIRFRFPLPEDVDCEGKSFDVDRESLFKGPPTTLQVTVYEKKFMSDVELGGADVSLDSLGTGGQIEEWVPLRVGKDGITWFARMRISLRFELMCLDTSGPLEEGKLERCPSIALKKIRSLSRLGAHEDHNMKNSISTPHLMGYFGNMLY
ncbi:hypothetical protein ACHAWO_005312 [Cyclotella atomus]|uniref:RAVE complex protein Rav1 C-terminal domain-containing protein n=1 Tax=Cyclotella atomus TaxID=382360 RepID=A0ABD3QWF9_9STRA